MKNLKLQKLKAEKAKQHRLITQQRHDESVKGIGEIKAELTKLYELINGKEANYNWSELIEQIKAIKPIVEIKNDLTEIESALKNIELPDQFKIKDIDTLIEAVNRNKPIKTTLDTEPIVNAIIQVQQRIQEQSTENVAPEDYKAFRRVVKVGNRLIFDDQPTPSRSSGGGGSSSSSNGLTDAELRASPVPVSSSISNLPADYPLPASQVTTLTPPAAITGFATSSKQDDLITELRIMNGAYAMRVDDTTGTIYQGWAEPGTATSAASWRIRKIVTSGTPEDTTITFADGTRAFTKIWDNRAGITYS